jgi:hypothetical protein
MSSETLKAATPAVEVVRILGAWLVVGAPLAWGIYATLQKAAQLFR